MSDDRSAEHRNSTAAPGPYSGSRYRRSGSVPSKAGVKPRAWLPDQDRLDAESFVNGGQLDTKRARELERQLAKHDEDELAEQVRSRRVEMDQARAAELLNASAPKAPQELFELAESLKQYGDFSLARRLLVSACEIVDQALEPTLRTRVFQQAAFCFYKDPDLPLEWKLNRALEMLSRLEDLKSSTDRVSLGIAGAIHKRKWEQDGRREHLDRALNYYLRAYALGAPPEAAGDLFGYLRVRPATGVDSSVDFGYSGINAAFVLDLLADQRQRDGISAPLLDDYRECARLIREDLIRSVPALEDRAEHAWLRDEWWYYATVAEAYFGLQRYAEAGEWLIDRPRAAGLRMSLDNRSSVGLRVPSWQYESTARQLAHLARLQNFDKNGQHNSNQISDEVFEQSEAAQLLGEFLGGERKAVLSAFRGKFGLALSGGGFRASLFHIGVLARLAEMGVLRHVEVISCVSGGAIVGAYYYLLLRNLLQTKTDAEITTSDYVQIVKRLEKDFLNGVQRNIRTRVFADFTTNLQMLLRASYSRSARLAELYESELYANIPELDERGRPIECKRRMLRDLVIAPLEEDGYRQRNFNPRWDNWRRDNKVPRLVLNACSLNTGHNWQFTATYMGEPPMPIHAEVDCNNRLRRFRYQDGPKGLELTLGQAVAASACFPGLFEPFILDELYPDDRSRRISVRLVDGGVCDNQGIASLDEQDCSVMLISDGSGQMATEDVPSASVIGVPLRSNSILQARVREAQYRDISLRRRSNQLRGLMFVHLKHELAGKALAWRDCPPAEKRSDEYEPRLACNSTAAQVSGYGIPREVQTRLAAVRTDLDSFSEAEAYSLMTSGYRMAAEQFRGSTPAVDGFPDVPDGDWDFHSIYAAMTGTHRRRLLKLLDASSASSFKVWSLSPSLIALKWMLPMAAVATAAAAIYLRWADWPTLRTLRLGLYAISYLVVGSVSLALSIVLGNVLHGWIRGRPSPQLRASRWRDTFGNIAIGLAMSLIGWLVARLHLWVFDPLYLRYGRVQRFIEKAPTGGRSSGTGKD